MGIDVHGRVSQLKLLRCQDLPAAPQPPKPSAPGCRKPLGDPILVGALVRAMQQKHLPGHRATSKTPEGTGIENRCFWVSQKKCKRLFSTGNPNKTTGKQPAHQPNLTQPNQPTICGVLPKRHVGQPLFQHVGEISKGNPPLWHVGLDTTKEIPPTTTPLRVSGLSNNTSKIEAATVHPLLPKQRYHPKKNIQTAECQRSLRLPRKVC